MRFSTRNLIGFPLAGILLLACTANAQAGFMLTELDDPASVQSTQRAMASVPSEPQPSQPKQPTVERVVSEQFGLHSSGSMTGNSSSVSGGGSSVPAAMLPTDADVTTRDLLAYQLAEPGLSLPVPFLDGVFRPPRG